MMGWPLPDIMLGDGNAMIYAFTQFLLLLPILAVNAQYFKGGFTSLWHRAPNMDALIALGAGASVSMASTRCIRSRSVWATATWRRSLSSPTTCTSRAPARSWR